MLQLQANSQQASNEHMHMFVFSCKDHTSVSLYFPIKVIIIISEEIIAFIIYYSDLFWGWT